MGDDVLRRIAVGGVFEPRPPECGLGEGEHHRLGTVGALHAATAVVVIG
jgi:hypothetical protein